MLNLAVAPSLINALLDKMHCHPFSVCTDGSNDRGLEKMNPLSIRIFDDENQMVVTRFLHMCPSRESTAEALFSVIDGKLSELLETPNPWSMCTSLGVDNTSVNIGVRNSIKTRVLQKMLQFMLMAAHVTLYTIVPKKVAKFIPLSLNLIQKNF